MLDPSALPQPNPQSNQGMNLNPGDPNNDITNFLINLFRQRQPVAPYRAPGSPPRYPAQNPVVPSPMKAQAQPDQDFLVTTPNGQRIKLKKKDFEAYNKDKDGFWLDYQGGKYSH